jgi:hypothetical protein
LAHIICTIPPMCILFDTVGTAAICKPNGIRKARDFMYFYFSIWYNRLMMTPQLGRN